MGLAEDVKALRDMAAEINRRLGEVEKTVSGIKGQPAIQGYVGQKLDLNVSLNVSEINKRITAAEARITALENA
jgi:predicted ATP-grasp superfamily ATP-dependent carboligase